MSKYPESHPFPPAEGCITTPDRTGCCIVGGGPAGLILALLLGRRGVPVVVLEAHRDFAREFRGNTLNPATLAILDDLGLTGSLLRRPHTKVRRFAAQTEGGETTFADFGRLGGATPSWRCCRRPKSSRSSPPKPPACRMCGSSWARGPRG